jgi:tetratricopeptide (TPR) repeat protein
VAAKGKSEPIPVWRAAQARSRVGEPETATQTPIVGREHERALLLETFLRVERESSVQLVTIAGEPGVGKSRLVTELRTMLDDRPEIVSWRHGRCLPYGEGITFWALGEVFKAEAGILESDDRDEVTAKLGETISALFDEQSEREWLVARLGPLVGKGGDAEGVVREEAFTAWRRFLEAMAARRPLVLVAEDLHWADGALLDFLDHLLDWAAPVPLLLLCTARPELYERRPGWGGGKRNATTISLSPLSAEETARLLQVLLERTLLPADTQARLLERSGGNPLYAEQFARMLAERGDAEDLPMPETVQALVAARLDTLGPELKALLHDASVVGRLFWTGAVTAIGSRERDEVRRSLNELVHREFVRPVRVSSIEGEDEFSFWHALVRDVAYQQIPRVPRADKHVTAARWVEETAEERVADHADILVHHYGQALELTQAAGEDRTGLEDTLTRVLLLAGDRAAQLDVDAAEACYRRALALSEHDERARAIGLRKLAPTLLARGAVVEGIEAYEEAIASLRAFDEHAAAVAMVELAQALWLRGEPARADAVGFEAIAILERDPGPDLVAAYGRAALRVAIGGRLSEAGVLLEKGLAVADELGIEDTTYLLQAKASVSGYEGDPRCVDDIREARELGLRLGDTRTAVIATNNLADATSWFEGLRLARAIWDEGIEFARARGRTSSVIWQRGERLRCLYHGGEWDELLREADEILRWEEEHGGGQLEVFAHVHLADVLTHRGSVADAATHVDLLLPQARESGDPQVLVPGLVVAALASSAQRDTPTALDRVTELERFTRTGSLTWRSLCLAWPVRVAVAAGELGLAGAFLESSEHRSAWDACARPTARATLVEARGRADEAAALYSQAAERWDEYGSVVERAYALVGLGRCGDAAALREGQAIFADLGASPVVARAA